MQQRQSYSNILVLRLEAEKTIDIFPNPSKGLFQIGELTDQFLVLKVFDNTGKIVMIQNSQDHGLDLSPFPDGLYFLQVTFKDQVITKRLVKQQ